ncbi:MAG: YkgJ family cysteine cluster protein [Alkalispirochaeta sp.]
MAGDAFYTEGLRFSCTQCSRCCRHDSGYVFLSESDLAALMRSTGLNRDEFIERYCLWVPFGENGHLSLTEQSNHDCIFWRDGGCSVYDDRPAQCRTYPFWEHILENEESWSRESRECPGIGVGRTHSFFEIRNSVALRVRNRPVRRF